MIRECTLADIDALVDIHCAALPTDLLPRLGRTYLARNYYPTILRSPNAVTFVYEEEGQVISFVVFAYKSGNLAREIKADKIGIAWALFKKSFRDPGIIINVINFLSSKIQLNKEIGSLEDYAELFSAASYPEKQGKGFGSLIVKEGLNRLIQYNCTGCSVKTSSERARKFYQRLGFEDIGEESRGNRFLYILFHPLRLSS